MGPSLATASGPEGRLRPEFLDCKGGPWWEGAGGSRREPLTMGALLEPRAAPLASLSRGRQQLPELPRLQEAKQDGPGDPQDQRVQCWARRWPREMGWVWAG